MHRSIHILFLIAAIAGARCNNIGLLDKLENPGGQSSANTQLNTKNYIFISSWTVQGNISTTPFAACNGLTGMNQADCSCTEAAAANNLRKNGTSAFYAWLSVSGIDAVCRIQGGTTGCSVNAPIPWHNTQGQVVANSLSALVSANTTPLQNAVLFTETGATPPDDVALTGTLFGGTAAANNCSSWSNNAISPFTAQVGSRIQSGGPWTDNGTGSCDVPKRLYCISAP